MGGFVHFSFWTGCWHSMQHWIRIIGNKVRLDTVGGETAEEVTWDTVI